MIRAFKLLLASVMAASFALPGAAIAHEPGDLTTANVSVATADLTISDAEQFKAFAEAVNSGTSYAGKTVALAADIELAQDTPSVGKVVQKDYIYQVSSAFQGTFDGQGHSILLKGKPLFGTIYGTKSKPVTVKNLVIGGTVESAEAYTGALAKVADGAVVLENVSNSASVSSTYRTTSSGGSGTGGLIGYVPESYNSYSKYYAGNDSALAITACANKGTVSSNSEYAGGFVGAFASGKASFTVDRCYVAGNVTSTAIATGGFIGGFSNGANYKLSFKNAYLSGVVSSSVQVYEGASQCVGNLVGYSHGSRIAKGNLSHVFFGPSSGNASFGDREESLFKGDTGTSVKQLTLAKGEENGSPTLAKLNGTDADEPDDNAGEPYTRETGFTYAADADEDAEPVLFWEAAASQAPVSKPQATMPHAVANLIYTGIQQEGVAPRATDGCGYALAGWQATDAGTHTATVTLEDGYEWADGSQEATRTVVYTIAKAKLTATYRGETIEWNGTPALEVAVTGFKNGDTAKSAKGYVAPTVTAPATTPGSIYTLTPAGGSAANYDFDYASGMLTVNAVPKPQLTQANTTISIDSRGSAVAVFVMCEGSLLTAGSGYVLTFRNAAGQTLSAAPTAKGTYTAVVTGKGTYEGTVTQQFTLTSDLTAGTGTSTGNTNTGNTGGTGNTTGSTGIGTGTATTTPATPATTAAKVGTTFKVTNATGTYTYKITSVKAGAKAATLTKAAVKSGKAASINTAKYQGTTYKVTAVAAKAFKSSKAKSATLGANVKKIGASAFTGASVKTLTVKSKALTKASVKNSLKGSKVATVKAPKGYAKKYAKLFTKANAGRKASVK